MRYQANSEIRFALLTLLLPTSISIAQIAPIGVWEVCLDPSTAPVDHIQHTFLQFDADGQYERILLSDDPAQPVVEERGTYEISQETITLTFPGRLGDAVVLRKEPVPYALSTVGDTLYWGEPAIPYQRAASPTDALYGTWGITNPFDGQIVGQIRLQPDGIYELELGGSKEKGPFVTAGSGLVRWPTQADQAEVVGIPAVWTNVHVEGDRLSYDIACSFTVTAVRLALTSVATASWAEIKKAFR